MIQDRNWVSWKPTKEGEATPPQSVESVAAAPRGNGRKLNVKEVPFRVMIEVVGVDQASLARAVSPFGWNASANADCSHGQHEWGKGTYVRLQSPDLHLNREGLENIGKALEAAKNVGAKIGETSAMRILVRNDKMDLDAFKEIYRIHLACEPILYRVSQNGHDFHSGEKTYNYMPAGFTLEHGRKRGEFYFCLRPSENPKAKYVLSANNVSALKSACDGNDRYGGKHQGFQPQSYGSPGYMEFRYFTSTLDPKVVEADAEMILGVVKAAYEGRWFKDTAVRPYDTQRTPPVPWALFQSFLDTVMGNSASRPLIEQLYRQAGGRLTQTVSPKDYEHLSRLEEEGYQLTGADGAKLSDLEGAVRRNEPICLLKSGDAQPTTIGARDLLAQHAEYDLGPIVVGPEPATGAVRRFLRKIFRRG